MKNKDWGRGRVGLLNREGGLIREEGLISEGELNRGFTVFVYTTTGKGFVIFTCWCFKLS